jgi:stage V sporulation protein AD
MPENMMQGKQSIKFAQSPHIIEGASIVGKKEGEGPLGKLFDQIVEDSMFGGESWEDAESRLQNQTLKLVLDKSQIDSSQIRYIFAGDLLGQLIATSFGILDYDIPVFGLFGACSTVAEALTLGAMSIGGGVADYVVAMASSHFGSAEKAFRFPLEYGNQRPYSSSWTVTGCGSILLGKKGGFARIFGVTTGKIVDFGLKDSLNMGACMAPAAADTIYQNFIDFNVNADYYDKIITGDLGFIGQKILIDLMKDKGFDISEKHTDCGIEIFDSEKQDTHAGGSGCGCAAVTLCSLVFKKLRSGAWKRVLFIPTGALLSTVSYNEGKSVPGIAHAVMIEKC